MYQNINVTFEQHMIDTIYDELVIQYHMWTDQIQFWHKLNPKYAYLRSKLFEQTFCNYRSLFRDYFDCFYWMDTNISEICEYYLIRTKFMSDLVTSYIEDCVYNGNDINP